MFFFSFLDLESGTGSIGKSGIDNTNKSGNGERIGEKYLSKLISLLEGNSYIFPYINLIVSILYGTCD